MVTSRRFDVNGNLRGDHRPKVHRAVDNATIATQSTIGRCDPRGHELNISHYLVN